MEQPQTVLNGLLKLLGILRVERLGPAPQLGGEDKWLTDVDENCAEDFLAVRVSRRGVEIVDAQVDRAMDGPTANLKSRAERGSKEAAETEFTDFDAGSSEASAAHGDSRLPSQRWGAPSIGLPFVSSIWKW